MTKPTLEITYCTSCNYMQRALWVAAELLTDFQYQIGELTLKCAARGEFDVRVSDRTIFSKLASGRFPDVDELKSMIFQEMEKLAGSDG